jgi:ArsR family transcriptional regulator
MRQNKPRPRDCTIVMDSKLFQRVARALADPTRFALLERISREGEVACMTLVEEFPITQATISHHLKELTGAELVASRKEGKCCHFTLRRDTLDAYRAQLAARLTGLPVQ